MKFIETCKSNSTAAKKVQHLCLGRTLQITLFSFFIIWLKLLGNPKRLVKWVFDVERYQKKWFNTNSSSFSKQYFRGTDITNFLTQIVLTVQFWGKIKIGMLYITRRQSFIHMSDLFASLKFSIHCVLIIFSYIHAGCSTF